MNVRLLLLRQSVQVLLEVELVLAKRSSCVVHAVELVRFELLERRLLRYLATSIFC